MSKYGFKAAHSGGQVNKQFIDFRMRIHRAIIVMLQYVGELCVKHARENGSYTDQTGNLRNSIGYVLVYNGDIISSNFEERVKGKVLSTANGMLEGVKLAEHLAKQSTKGYSVIVVAGMNYAMHVESLNKDVLDGAERMAERIVPQMMSDLSKQVARVWQSM